MPVLCLIQASPLALFAFSSLSDSDEKICMGFSNYYPRPCPLDVGPEFDDDVRRYLVNPKTFNVLLGNLAKFTLTDYINGRLRLNMRVNLHSKLNLTQLLSVGTTRVKMVDDQDYNYPSLFTFGIYKDYTLSILYNDPVSYNFNFEFMRPIGDRPSVALYDWGPAIGCSHRAGNYPLVRMYELYSLISAPVGENDFCLSYLIEQALLKGEF